MKKTKVDRERVRTLVRGLLPTAVDRAAANPALYGAGSGLDSLGLVNLLADVELAVSAEFGRDIVLASERAMSRRHSPFRDVEALADYVVELLDDSGSEVGS